MYANGPQSGDPMLSPHAARSTDIKEHDLSDLDHISSLPPNLNGASRRSGTMGRLLLEPEIGNLNKDQEGKEDNTSWFWSWVALTSHVDADRSHIVLVPHPSDTDPNDPLRWPRWKKHVAFTSVCAFTFLTNYGLGGLGPAFYPLSLEFNKTMTETSALLLWPILVLGIFNFFWVPMANYFGKRPIFVFASLVLCVAYIWGSVAQTFDSLLWSNIVAAFAGSSTEALGAAIVNDLYFLHERGSKMSLYMISISGGNTVGPLICGFVVQSLGWRWHKRMAVIFTAVNFIAVLLFVPETRYNRLPSSSVSDFTQTASDSDISNSGLEKKAIENTKEISAPQSPTESSPPPFLEVPKKTFAQHLSLWSGVPKETNLFKMFIRPFPLLCYPAVLFAFIGYAASLAWVVAVNILNPFILEAPPYSWGPAIDGLINIPGLIGNIVGSFVGGWCVDRWSAWRARKNNGVFEPETRLTLLIVPTILVPAGCILFGYGVERTLNWTSLFFGYGLIAVGLTAVPTITMTYVSDCYLPVAADALLLINGLKNIVAFGFLYGVVPWVMDAGYVNAFGTQAGVFIAVMLLGLPLALFGGRIRRTTGEWKIIM